MAQNAVARGGCAGLGRIMVTFTGGAGNDTATGSTGNDQLYGGGGNDTLWGGAGDDSLGGGTGLDMLSGGLGNDTVDGGDDADLLTGGQGIDRVYGGAGNDTLIGDGQIYDAWVYKSGTGGTTTTLRVVNTADGPITLSMISSTGSLTSVATIQAGQTLNYTTLTTTNFFLLDDQGYYLDVIQGGNQTVTYAPQGNDILYGGADQDLIYGQFGADLIYGDDGNDTVYGGTGTDTIYGGNGGDSLFGGAGNDLLYGDAGNDTIFGGAGNDVIYAGLGNDVIDSGSGDETVYAGSGNDSVQLGDGNDVFGDWSVDDSGNDTIDGGAGDDRIFGGAGDDTVYGGEGNDTLSGQTGNDVLYGGGGADSFWITDDHNGDTIFGGETGTDSDTLSFSTYASKQGVNVVFTGDEAGQYGFVGTTGAGSFAQIETISGTDYDDKIDANASRMAQTLYGGSGADSLIGGQAADALFGGKGDDRIFGGKGADNLWGGDGNDLLRGGAGRDTLEGGAGKDTFQLEIADSGDLIADFDMSFAGKGLTTDQLDVSELRDSRGGPVKTWDVKIDAIDGKTTILYFPNGESVILAGISADQVSQYGMLHSMGVPCFVSGTRILTPSGEREVQEIAAGDLVQTMGGPEPVLWHGQRCLDAAELGRNPAQRPIRLRAGTFGCARDLVLSPQHGVVVAGPDGLGLARAAHLTGAGGRVAMGQRSVSYHHLLLPAHALIMAEGAAVESFYPGPMALAALAPTELRALLMVMARHAPRGYGPRCLPLLTRKAVSRLLLDTRAVKSHLKGFAAVALTP